MTRLYYSAGQLRPKMILAIFLGALFFAATEIFGFRRFLGLSPEAVTQHSLVVACGGAFLFVALSAFSWFYLRPAALLLEEIRRYGRGGPRHDEAARANTLRFPLALVGFTLAAGLLTVAAGVAVEVKVLEAEPQLVAGVAAGSLAVILVASLFLYVISRTLVRPITAHFRHEDVPGGGGRVSVGTKVLFAVVALGAFATVPTAVICARRVRVTQLEAHERQQLHLAELLAYAGAVLDRDQLRDLLAAVKLPDGTRVRLGDDASRGASPLPAGQAASYLEVAAPADFGTSHTTIVLLSLGVLAMAFFVGGLLGIYVSREVSLVTGRIRDMARPEDEGAQVRPLVAGAPQFSDVRSLASAVNLLLARIAEMHVAHFVAIERMLAADRLKMQFLANVSHDLRSPLNSVLGFSELLLRDLPTSRGDPRREGVQTIHRSGTELLRLIDEVLDSAKLEAGRLAVHREDSLPAEIVRQSIQEINRQGVPPSVKLETELQAGLPTIWVDPHRFGQALCHLLRYSISSLEKGQVVVRVRTESLEQEDASGAKKRLQIRIADTGRGLAGEEVGRLFVGFRRNLGGRGLGLGLPLAKALVEMHGGTLQVFSTPGVGTTFAIDLPVLQRKVLGRLRPVKV